MALLCLRSEMASGRGSLYCKTCFCFWRNGLSASDKHQQASKSTSTELKSRTMLIHCHQPVTWWATLVCLCTPKCLDIVGLLCMPHRILSIKAYTHLSSLKFDKSLKKLIKIDQSSILNVTQKLIISVPTLSKTCREYCKRISIPEQSTTASNIYKRCKSVCG